MFTEKEILKINKVASENSFEVETYVSPHDDNPRGVIEFTFEITGNKKMISVGEYYDYVVYNITILGITGNLKKYLAIIVKIFLENYKGESTTEKLASWFKRDTYILRPTVGVIMDFMKYFISTEYAHLTLNEVIISDKLMEDIQETIIKNNM